MQKFLAHALLGLVLLAIIAIGFALELGAVAAYTWVAKSVLGW